MGKKTYRIGSYSIDWFATVEIDFGHTFIVQNNTRTTDEAIKEMVEFWSGWKFRLKDLHNDYTLVFLNNLACEIISVIAEHNYNLAGVLTYFKTAEGWYPMDGSAGITIKHVDSFRWLDNLDVDIEEVEQ